MRRPLLFSLLAVPALAAGLVVVACSDESEGQPCSHQAGNNGDDDCQSGLTCQDLIGVQGPRCCPPNRSQATTPECTLPSGVIDASPAPPDGRTTETSTQDSPGEAQGEASTDAPAEGMASDAPAETAAEGGDAATD
jgi:hypothetical protein